MDMISPIVKTAAASLDTSNVSNAPTKMLAEDLIIPKPTSEEKNSSNSSNNNSQNSSSNGSVATYPAGILSPTSPASPVHNSSNSINNNATNKNEDDTSANAAVSAATAPFSDEMMVTRPLHRKAYTRMSEASVPSITRVCYNVEYSTEEASKFTANNSNKNQEQPKEQEQRQVKYDEIYAGSTFLSYYLRQHRVGRICAPIVEQLEKSSDNFRAASKFCTVSAKLYQIESTNYMVDFVERCAVLFVHAVFIFFLARYISNKFEDVPVLNWFL